MKKMALYGSLLGCFITATAFAQGGISSTAPNQVAVTQQQGSWQHDNDHAGHTPNENWKTHQTADESNRNHNYHTENEHDNSGVTTTTSDQSSQCPYGDGQHSRNDHRGNSDQCPYGDGQHNRGEHDGKSGRVNDDNRHNRDSRYDRNNHNNKDYRDDRGGRNHDGGKNHR